MTIVQNLGWFRISRPACEWAFSLLETGFQEHLPGFKAASWQCQKGKTSVLVSTYLWVELQEQLSVTPQYRRCIHCRLRMCTLPRSGWRFLVVPCPPHQWWWCGLLWCWGEGHLLSAAWRPDVSTSQSGWCYRLFWRCSLWWAWSR